MSQRLLSDIYQSIILALELEEEAVGNQLDSFCHLHTNDSNVDNYNGNNNDENENNIEDFQLMEVYLFGRKGETE